MPFFLVERWSKFPTIFPMVEISNHFFGGRNILVTNFKFQNFLLFYIYLCCDSFSFSLTLQIYSCITHIYLFGEDFRWSFKNIQVAGLRPFRTTPGFLLSLIAGVQLLDSNKCIKNYIIFLQLPENFFATITIFLITIFDN